MWPHHYRTNKTPQHQLQQLIQTEAFINLTSVEQHLQFVTFKTSENHLVMLIIDTGQTSADRLFK